MSILPRIGARSRRAASLTDLMSDGTSAGPILPAGVALSVTTSATEVETTGVGAGGSGASVAGAGVAIGSATGGIGMAVDAVEEFGIIDRIVGRGAAGLKSLMGLGPTGPAIVPLSSSDVGAGVATGSEKTGSALVFLVMSSIAFCKSLSTVGFICPPLIKCLYLLIIYISTLFLNAQEIYEFIE